MSLIQRLKLIGWVFYTQMESLTLQYPTCIPNHLQHHFLRGYFDGDGSINSKVRHWKTTTNTNWAWSITSSSFFCTEAKRIIDSANDLKLYSRISNAKENDITTTLSVGGNRQVYRILSWLYKDATIFLKRKHDEFLTLETYINAIDKQKAETRLKSPLNIYSHQTKI